MAWVPSHIRIQVSDQCHIGEVRRAAQKIADGVGIEETPKGRLAIVATELATNIVRHAQRGEVLLRPLENRDPGEESTPAVELFAVDSGPGMGDSYTCLQDGFSTAGTSGTGLGAIQRLSSEFGLFSLPGSGTVARVVVRNSSGTRNTGNATSASPAISPRRLSWGSVALPISGEIVCGDGHAVHESPSRLSLLVADGLGHGPLAAQAAHAAFELFVEDPLIATEEYITRAHRRLSGTRGAAVAIAQIDLDHQVVTFSGLGNISAFLLSGSQSQGLCSQNGAAGVQCTNVQRFTYPWSGGATLVVHSDGLQSRWRTDRYGAVQALHPALLAALLYRDFQRGRDDVTVVAVQLPEKEKEQ